MPRRSVLRENPYSEGWEDGYRMGYQDGVKSIVPEREQWRITDIKKQAKPKRKLSAWNKYVKNKRNHITYRDGKLNLKKMGVEFRRKRRR